MIVVDVNVIAYHWFVSPHGSAVEELLSRDSHWVAPPLWRSEFRNILVSQMRIKKLATVDALNIWEETDRMMEKKEYAVNSNAVLLLASESNCSAYDCEYIALAYQLEVNLITYDKQLL